MVIGGNMAAFNALMLGTALYKARLVPRAIPALGIVGAPILITWVIGMIGRRSGRTRVAIVGYHEEGPNLVTLAMNGWAKKLAGWAMLLGVQARGMPLNRVSAQAIQSG